MPNPRIVIIGGGLSVLLTAYRLKGEGLSPKVIEARSRLGGRIYTRRTNDGLPIEMGATWLGKKHHHLTALLDELGIEIDKQYMGSKGYYEPMSVSPPQLVDLPPNDQPSYRITGGTDQLIQSLADKLDSNQLFLDQPVTAIHQKGTALEVETRRDRFEADRVICTLPPKLLVETIDFTPALPDDFVTTAAQTQTWMADAIKVALTFDEPIWQNENSSGTIFSNVGPVGEMYDHSDETHYALKGFMNNAYRSVSREQRKEIVINQLQRFYGGDVDHCMEYHEMVWSEEKFTFRPYQEVVVPHQNNGHALFQKPLWNNRLFITGAETASSFPGYMDGAIESSERTTQQLKKLLM